MSAISSLCSHSVCLPRPVFQVPLMPIRAIYAIFLRAIASILSILGCTSWARSLQFRAIKIENEVESLANGLSLFGRRFLVATDNHGKVEPLNFNEYQAKGYCKGSSYWLVEQVLKNPQMPVLSHAQKLEGQVPDAIARLHDEGALPVGVDEQPLHAFRLDSEWNEIPSPESLPNGAYTIRITYWIENPPQNIAHRMALIKEEGKIHYFDPSIGLARIIAGDWPVVLEDIAAKLKSFFQESGSYSYECFSHSLR